MQKVDVVAISSFAGSVFIMPYAEIEASFQQKLFWSIFVGGLFLFFDYSSLVVFKILREDDNWFSSIITLLHYYVLLLTLLNLTNITFVLIIKWKRYPFWILFSTSILNYTWKVISLTRVICNHELGSFQDRISSSVLRYVKYILTWHILHVWLISKYIILWHVKYQMWRC